MAQKSTGFPNMFADMFSWTSMAYHGTMLAIESQQVIAMRLTKMALGGPGVRKEAELMVSEKMETAAESSRMMLMAMLGGQSDMGAEKVMTLYRRKVTANRRRLSA
jgi:hypothetical protein